MRIIMATLSTPSPAASLAAFRAALPVSASAALTADRLCALGVSVRLAKGDHLPPDPVEDRLVHVASGAAKLVTANGTAPSPQVLAFHFIGDLVSVLRQRASASSGDCQLVALSECQLVIFPSDRFLDIAQSDPSVLRSVLT
jgi:CRP/FNR family transcriptional regulator